MVACLSRRSASPSAKPMEFETPISAFEVAPGLHSAQIMKTLGGLYVHNERRPGPTVIGVRQFNKK